MKSWWDQQKARHDRTMAFYVIAIVILGYGGVIVTTALFPRNDNVVAVISVLLLVLLVTAIVLGANFFRARYRKLVQDRRDSPYHCRVCGYDVSVSIQINSPNCSECGTPLSFLERDTPNPDPATGRCHQCGIELIREVFFKQPECPNCKTAINLTMEIHSRSTPNPRT